MPGVVYPPAEALRRYAAAGVLTQETLAGALAESFARNADRLALAGPEGEYTYRALDEITDRLGAALLDLGLQPLDRVLFQISNCNELLFGFVACLKAGLIPICTLAAHREQEIGYLGNHAKARLHFVNGDDPKFDDVAFAERMGSAVPSVRWILQARGARRGSAHHLAELIESVSPAQAKTRLGAVPRDPFQVAVFQLSGGTTGVPKIIPRFHNEYLYQWRAVARFNGYRADDRLFNPMPFVHNMNMGCCFGPFLLTGGTVTVAPDLAPKTLSEIFRQYEPTWAAFAGPIVAKLQPAIQSGTLPLTKLRSVIAPSSAPALRELLGAPVYHLFGMTEGTVMFTHPGDPQEVLDTLHGRPVSEFDEVKLFKPGTEEEILDEGVEGECAFRGPYTIHGYYDAPERNRETFTSDGFYRSGDLMLWRTFDGKRYYQFRGRTKDVVDRANEKINCEEVELAVNKHSAIVSSAVVGMPDPVYGERVCAYVVVREGMRAPSVAELGAFLQEVGIAKFKWPERLEVVDDFPMTKSGKVSKPMLKAMIAEQLGTEQSRPSNS
jgi:non-ribosomal peptide synthetase component E (peptide arylation enzyme)